MTDIARHEQLPYPTAFRIVQTLIHEGLIEKEDRGKRYRPTALVHSLSSGYSDTMLRQLAQPHLSALTRDISWPVFIAIRTGTRMVVQASTHHETTLTFSTCEQGVSIPLAGSATGLAFLAHLPIDQARNFINWGLEASGTPPTADEVANQIDLLERVRQQGYMARACLHNQPNKTASVAVPVFQNDQIHAVLTMTYFAVAMKENQAVERYVHRLAMAAKDISDALSQKDFSAVGGDGRTTFNR